RAHARPPRRGGAGRARLRRERAVDAPRGAPDLAGGGVDGVPLTAGPGPAVRLPRRAARARARHARAGAHGRPDDLRSGTGRAPRLGRGAGRAAADARGLPARQSLALQHRARLPAPRLAVRAPARRHAAAGAGAAARRARGGSRAMSADVHWSGLAERGSMAALRAMAWIYRVLGRRTARPAQIGRAHVWTPVT